MSSSQSTEDEDGGGDGGVLGHKSLQLPAMDDLGFRNISEAKLLALDIGGSLTKIAYYSTVPCRKIVYDSQGVPASEVASDGEGETVYEVSEGARLHFTKFETKHIDLCLDYINQSLLNRRISGLDIKVTGGGAYKYAELIQAKVGLPIDKMDEMTCIVHGCNFLLKNISDEAFVYQRKGTPEYVFQTIEPQNDLYPYLLVTIGSGVSVLKVESDSKFERIGGTATGGGTFWGLGKLLTNAKGFDELLELASRGDHRKVDMLVRDIYGEKQDYDTLGLPADLIASSFGKAIHKEGKRDAHQGDFSDADVARSLLYMISNDVGQIASLYAMLHKVKCIYFGGFFLRHHPVSMHTIGYSVNYWTKGEVQARFLRHEGYLGAIGAFLKGAENGYQTDEYSWQENLYGSSAASFPTRAAASAAEPSGSPADESVAKKNVETPDAGRLKHQSTSVEVDHLEIDRYEAKLGFCPLLLDPKSYVADTVDLMSDNDAREYWLQCLQDSLPKFTERAIKSQPHSSGVAERAEQFRAQFLSRLHHFKHNPFAHGSLSVRSLLDLREHCLAEFDFHDPYLRQKQYENDQAMSQLSGLLAKLAELPWEQRQRQLTRGLLAGNVFDWGAKEVALIMESKGGLDFDEALNLIGPRPWLMDSLDAWVERLREPRPPHKCAAIFIDNSGVDVVLGIFPFVAELLSRGTQVLLCANNRPVLNDVTHAELGLLLARAARVSHVFEQALKDGRLQYLNSGQASPCLDLARLDKTVVDAMVEKGVDLLVLEGMGRAVHTNLYTNFKCECLKVAVLKNRWLASKLGGDMYAVVFKYTNSVGLAIPEPRPS